MSSRGYLTDMIESIGEKIALASHIEEKIRAIDDEQEKKNLEKVLWQVIDLRREQMNQLLMEAENPNPTYWCQFKHSVGSFIRDVELYEATKSDESFSIMKKSADILAMNTSLFLGMEFEVCARCLADKLLVKQVEKEHSDILKSNEKEIK